MWHSPAEQAPGHPAGLPVRPALLSVVDQAPWQERPGLELDLSPDDLRFAQARGVIRDQLAQWNIAAGADELVLAAQELIANAARHGCASPDDGITVAMSRFGDRVHLAVYDPSPEPPTVREPSDDDETGRGLLLVTSLCDRWGVLPTQDGKWVWLTIAVAEADISQHDEVSVA